MFLKPRTKRAAQEQDAMISEEFVDYMNQKRAEVGLDPLEWDENLANEAMRRAEEIISNFREIKIMIRH